MQILNFIYPYIKKNLYPGEVKTDIKIFKDYRPIENIIYLKRPLSLMGQWSMPKSESAHFNVTARIGNSVLKIDPVIGISTCSDLQGMRDNFNTNYELLNDINCSDTINWNSGEGFIPIGNATSPFKGNLSGNNHIISNLYINRNNSYTAMFGYTYSKHSVFSNFGLENVWVRGSNLSSGYTAGVFAMLFSEAVPGKIDIENVYVTGNVNGSNYVGMMLGLTPGTGGTIWVNNSYAKGNVTCNHPVNFCGGFAAAIGGSTGAIDIINSSYFVGNVSVNSPTTANFIGGFAGAISNFRGTARVHNCWTDSYVNTTASGALTNLGAFAGNWMVTSASNITWNNRSQTQPWCYWKGGVNCNVVQNNPSYFYDISNEPMKYWDFVTAWGTCNNLIDYPIFKWQCPIIPPKPVNYTMTTEMMNQTEWFNTEEITKSQLSGSMLYILLLVIIIFCHIISETTKIPAFFIVTGIMTFFFGFFITSVFSTIIGISIISESILFSVRGLTFIS